MLCSVLMPEDSLQADSSAFCVHFMMWQESLQADSFAFCVHFTMRPESLQAEDSKDAKEIAAILAEENVELVPEEDREKVQELDSLTGRPRATDILLYALPVICPPQQPCSSQPRMHACLKVLASPAL